MPRLTSRVAQIAVGRHLSYRIVRVRLTLLYGGLFLLSGAALMVIAYLLLANAGFVFTLQNQSNNVIRGPAATSAQNSKAALVPNPGLSTHPSSATMTYWRDVARCMRRNGVAAFPEPMRSVPRGRGSVGAVSYRDGAILAFPAGVDQRSAAFTRAANGCGYYVDSFKQLAQQSSGRTQTRQQLLLQSGIALAGMTLLSLGLGWLMAGRVLQPLEDSYEAQRQFVANASHELRAPLTLSRGQAGLERQEQLDLAAVVADVVLAHEDEARGLGLSVRASLEHAPVQADPRLIERLFANLISNAIRHNTTGGEVGIVTGARERAAFASVTNTGPMVGPEHVERLFRPFERLGARAPHRTAATASGSRSCAPPPMPIGPS